MDTDTDRDRDRDKHKLLATRYERTSELIKALKHSCSRVRGDPFHSLEMELPEFTAVLDEMTKNTYVLVIVHDTRIGEFFVGVFFLVFYYYFGSLS